MKSVLKEPYDCVGCGNCYRVCSKKAIDFQPDKDGFLYPVLNQNCIDCGKCQSVCPVLNKANDKVVKKINAAWSYRYRKKSSSGGIFSELAVHVLNMGGVVYGAAMENDCICRHIRIENENDLFKLRGSKYVNSDVCECFTRVKEDLKNNIMVLFSGIPCQIAALYAFLKGCDTTLLLTIEILCKGGVAQSIFHSYLKKLTKEMNIKYPNQVSFRYLSSSRYLFRLISESNKEISIPINLNTYLSAFGDSAIFRESCYVCKYKTLIRIGDISLGDLHFSGKFPYRISAGVSLVAINSSKGERLYNSIQPSIFNSEMPIEQVVKENSAFCGPKTRPSKRDIICMDFLNPSMSLYSINKKYGYTYGISSLLKSNKKVIYILDILKDVKQILK